MKNNERKNYCALPFVHTAIEANGDVKACCLTPPFKTDQGKSFNLNKHELHQVYSSKDFNEFIQAFRADQRHPYCVQCWSDDDSGTVSNRKKFTHWANIYTTGGPETKERELKFLEVKVGNLCNLMCRICGPHNSSKAAMEEYKLTGNPKVMEPVEKSRWILLDKVWDQLSESPVEAIHIMGGEPFADKSHLKLLENLISAHRSSEILLWYNTNGTIVPKEHIKYWESFKEVSVSISIDDFGSRFEYQRYPAKWEKVEANICELYRWNEKKNFKVELDICWSLFNIYYIDEIIDYFEEFFQRNLLVFGDEIAGGNHHYTGSYYCPKTLSEEERRRFISKLKSSKHIDSKKYGELVRRLISHVDFDMYKPEVERARMQKISLQDALRKQKFSQVFPELSFIKSLN